MSYGSHFNIKGDLQKTLPQEYPFGAFYLLDRIHCQIMLIKFGSVRALVECILDCEVFHKPTALEFSSGHFFCVKIGKIRVFF